MRPVDDLTTATVLCALLGPTDRFRCDIYSHVKKKWPKIQNTPMSSACFRAPTLDDAIRMIFEEILQNGEPVKPSKGATLEIAGVVVEIGNPRARLSRTETRGRPFGCLGELCWYLAGSNNVEFISYYLSRYREFEEEGRLFGAYGPSLAENCGRQTPSWM